MGPDCCRRVILFSLFFLTHIVAAGSEVVKTVQYERERLNFSLPPEKDPDVGKPLPPGCSSSVDLAANRLIEKQLPRTW